VPAFHVFPKGRAIRRPARLKLPLFVKSVTEEGSRGISQASLVRDDEKFRERVEFIHRQVGTDAIAEEYIEGRELYVGMVGNARLTTFPVWELLFTKMPADMPRIATGSVKWNVEYQKKWGIETQAATDLPAGASERIQKICKRAYRILDLSGYARMDLRMTDAGEVYVLEANPNPQIGYGEDFAESAEVAGIGYEPGHALPRGVEGGGRLELREAFFEAGAGDAPVVLVPDDLARPDEEHLGRLVADPRAGRDDIRQLPAVDHVDHADGQIGMARRERLDLEADAAADRTDGAVLEEQVAGRGERRVHRGLVGELLHDRISCDAQRIAGRCGIADVRRRRTRTPSGPVARARA